jgi:hypothetical protein
MYYVVNSYYKSNTLMTTRKGLQDCIAVPLLRRHGMSLDDVLRRELTETNDGLS